MFFSRVKYQHLFQFRIWREIVLIIKLCQNHLPIPCDKWTGGIAGIRSIHDCFLFDQTRNIIDNNGHLFSNRSPRFGCRQSSHIAQTENIGVFIVLHAVDVNIQPPACIDQIRGFHKCRSRLGRGRMHKIKRYGQQISFHITAGSLGGQR